MSVKDEPPPGGTVGGLGRTLGQTRVWGCASAFLLACLTTLVKGHHRYRQSTGAMMASA